MEDLDKRMTLGFNQEQEIVDTIMNIIKKYHPVGNQRHKLIRDKDRLDLEVHFDFGTEKNGKDFTWIEFFDSPRTSCYLKKIPDSLEVEGILSETCLFNLVNTILLDHSVVSEFEVGENTISIEFRINYTNHSEGIWCDKISFIYDFYGYDRKYDLRDAYLNFFAANFLEKFKNTSYFSCALKRYVRLQKTNFITELASDGLRDFICSLSDEDLKFLLGYINDEKFMELKKDYEERGKRLELKKN